MIKGITILIGISTLMMNLSVKACSCMGPDKFVNSISSLIMEVEVLDVIALDTGKYAYTSTRMKVNRVLKGEYLNEEILILNDKGFECFHTVPNREKGRKYILTGNVLDEITGWEYRMDSTYYGRMMVLDLCSENYLFLEGKRVKGNVTKNRAGKIRFRHRIYWKINKEAASKCLSRRQRPPKSNRLMQKMSIARLERILSRRIDSMKEKN